MQINRKRVYARLGASFDSVDIWVHAQMSAHELPSQIDISIEDMWPISMDSNPCARIKTSETVAA